MTIRFQKATPVILALWLFSMGFAFGLWLNFTESADRAHEIMRSMQEMAK